MGYLIYALFGLMMGSFANVCILRLPKDESLWRPRSHCPKCGHQLRIIDNIPLISFAALRGKCRSCGTPISWQYPMIEALFGFLFMFHAWFFFPSFNHLVVADVLGFYLITISIIDYRHRIIPDELSLSLIGFGLLFSFLNPYLPGFLWTRMASSLSASVGGGLLMLSLAYAGEKAFKKEALGGGDIKLIAATGSVLGLGGIVGPLLLGSICGGFFALVLLIARKKKMGETLPFGPFLSFGAYVSCLFPGWWTVFFRT